MKKTINPLFLTVFIMQFIIAPWYVTPVSAAEDKIRIAVLDLKADAVTGTKSRTITNMIRTEIVNTGKFTVVERSQVDIILKEQGFQQTGCTDQECAVQIGKVLSVRKMLIGEVAEVEGSMYITIRIVDVERGEIEYAEKEITPTGESLDAAITRLTDRLVKRLSGEKAVAKTEEQKPAEENGPSQQVIRGNAPAGLVISYSLFMPLASDFKDIYSLLMGGTIGYLYPLDTNLALTGSAFCLTGESDSGDSRTTFTGGAFGARAGLPLFGFMYPYLGAAARCSWLYEQGKSDNVNFFAWDIDGLAGVAFMFGEKYGVNLECAYAFGRVTDEAVTDVSGISFNGGIIIKVW